MGNSGPQKDTYARRPAPDPSWATHGSCARHPDPDLWFAYGDAEEPRAQQAIAICQACPVKAACLDYALSDPRIDGIWAGTTKTARTRLHRQARSNRAA